MAETPTSGPPPEEAVTGKPFYESALRAAGDVAGSIMAAHPEVRSVITVFDYRDRLNDARLPQMLWLETDPDGSMGNPTTPEAMVGGMRCLLNLLKLGITRVEDMMAIQANQAKEIREQLREAFREQRAAGRTGDNEDRPTDSSSGTV